MKKNPVKIAEQLDFFDDIYEECASCSRKNCRNYKMNSKADTVFITRNVPNCKICKKNEKKQKKFLTAVNVEIPTFVRGCKKKYAFFAIFAIGITSNFIIKIGNFVNFFIQGALSVEISTFVAYEKFLKISYTRFFHTTSHICIKMIGDD